MIYVLGTLIGKVLRGYLIFKALVTGYYTNDLESLETALAVHGRYLYINTGEIQDSPMLMMFTADCGHHN